MPKQSIGNHGSPARRKTAEAKSIDFLFGRLHRTDSGFGGRLGGLGRAAAGSGAVHMRATPTGRRLNSPIAPR